MSTVESNRINPGAQASLDPQVEDASAKTWGYDRGWTDFSARHRDTDNTNKMNISNQRSWLQPFHHRLSDKVGFALHRNRHMHKWHKPICINFPIVLNTWLAVTGTGATSYNQGQGFSSVSRQFLSPDLRVTGQNSRKPESLGKFYNG